MGIEPGDPVVPDSPFMVLNGSDNYLGKAWDDRIGCAVLLAAMQRTNQSSHSNQLFYVATTQEEIGLRGARTAAQVVKPDIGIAIEGGIVGDTPGSRPEETQAKLGGGPGIFLYDSSALANRKLVSLVKKVAAAKGIPLQFDLVQGYGDDSAEMQLSNGGVPTMNIVVPVRYTHAHNGIVNRKDFDKAVDLVVSLVESLDRATVSDLRDFYADKIDIGRTRNSERRAFRDKSGCATSDAQHGQRSGTLAHSAPSWCGDRPSPTSNVTLRLTRPYPVCECNSVPNA